MKPLQSELNARPDVLRAKHAYGIWFGALLGLAFAIAAWGIDAFMLNQANGLLPWLKFVGGAIPCMLVGSFTGWLSAKLNRSILSVLLWLAAGSIFAWLTVSLPLQIAPGLMGIMEPDTQGLLHYTYYEEFSARVGVAYVWIAIFVALAGLLQIPLSDSAVFSTSWMGKLAPMLVCLVLMGIAGIIVDSLNNEPLRSATTALDNTIQFSIDHKGREIDPAESRLMHLGALKTIEDAITPQHKLIVSGYDAFLGEIQVLIKFEHAWAECKVFYNQPISCKKVSDVP
jgi:hypothetical protein